MSSFLIDRDSPIRSVGNSPRSTLYHRSRHSESESNDSPIHSCRPPSQQTDDQKQNSQDVNSQNMRGPSMFNYFKSELTRSYKLEGDASEFVQRRDRIYTSVNTPKSFEKFCAFGLLQCLDSILNVMTFLPLRIIVALLHVLTYPCAILFLKKKAVLTPAQMCDILKGVILVVSCFITSYIDMSVIYHVIKQQSVMKFYVIYNMLDVMDKLISGFGQDVLDSLYWTAVEPRGRKREHFGTIFHLIFAIAYVVIHTFLILVQAITLNVAFNSENKSLLTILLSNNFIEIKANLFKRLDKSALCQITYGDVKERFHYFVLLLFAFIHNLLDKEWTENKSASYLANAIFVLCAEVIVDWIKHSFITKINEFSPSCYSDFAVGLAQDIDSSQKKHAFTDFSDQVCRRMGFTPIPLTCLLYMVFRKTFKITGALSLLLVFMLYLCLLTTKVLNSIILLGWAQHLITQGDKCAESNVIVGNSQVMPKKEDKRVKTESISHCPDTTCTLSHSLLSTSEQAVIYQSPWLPLQTSGSPPSLNPMSETTTSETPEKSDEDLFLENNLQTKPVSPLLVLDQNGENNEMLYESNMLQSESEVGDSVRDVVEVEGDSLFDKNGKDQGEDDIYSILLPGVSDSSTLLSEDSVMSQSSVSSEDSPNILKSKDVESSTPQLLKESNQPFMLKLSSSLPLGWDQGRNNNSLSDKEMLPSLHSSSLDVLPSIDSAALFSRDNETSLEVSGSNDTPEFIKENIEERETSPRKVTDL